MAHGTLRIHPTLGKPQKSSFLSGPATKRGVPLRKKDFFFNVRKKVPMATKPMGGGGLKALVAGPLRKELFLRLPLHQSVGFREYLEFSALPFFAIKIRKRREKMVWDDYIC